MAHAIHRPTGLVGLVAASALALPAAAAGSTDDQAPDRRSAEAVRQPEVSLASSLWSVQDDPQAMRVRTAYPRSTPPESYDGKPVDVQVMRSDGGWETVGTARQQRVADKPRTTAIVEFAWPESGRLRIRARSHPESGTYTSKRALVDVRADTPAFDPTALPQTGDFCGNPSIANRQRIAYDCGDTIATPVFVYDHATGTRDVFARRSTEPAVADRAEVAVAEKVFNGGRDYRTQRTDLDSGKASFVARKRNGKPVFTSFFGSSISSDGHRVVYSSAARGIVRDAPRGMNIYLNRSGERRSRFVAHGTTSEISGNGRFVAWRTINKLRVRRTNLRTGRTITVPGSELGGLYNTPSISNSGRYIAYEDRSERPRRVRMYDAHTGKTRTLGRGEAPSISGDGSRVAYRGADYELRVWSRDTGESTLVSVGMTGRGSGMSFDYPPDISVGGRWVVAVADSPRAAPDNGRERYDGRNDIVLYDLAELED